MKNKKGFTLVELIAVIVIISILVLMVIVAVTRYVEDSKRKAFIEDAKTMVSAARSNYASGDLDQIPDVEETLTAVTYSENSINAILDKNLNKSSYQSDYKNYGVKIIKLTNEDGSLKYEYRVCLIDEDGNGFNYVKLEDLDSDHFSTDLQNTDCSNLYMVNLVVKNGKPTSAKKSARPNENVTFNVKPDKENADDSVNCTNEQQGQYEDGVITVKNVSNDTTCTVNFSIPLTPPEGFDRVYNGKMQDGPKCPTGSETSGSSKKDVGNYFVTCTLLSGYKWNDGETDPKNVNWRITPKPISIKAKDQTINYGESISSTSSNVTVEGLIDGHSVHPTLAQSTNQVTTSGAVNISSVIIKDENGVDVTDNYDITKASGLLKINPIKCATPTELSVSTAGYITWKPSTNCPNGRHVIKIDNGDYNAGDQGGDYNNTLISGSSSSKKVYIKVEAPNANYIDSNEDNITVSILNITFASSDTNKGTVSPTSKRVISGSTVDTSNNNLIIKGVTTGSNTTNLVSVTPTPVSGYNFNSWSKTSGSLTSDQTITASWSDKPVRIYFHVNGGQINGSVYTLNGSWVKKISPTSEDCQVNNYFCQQVDYGQSAHLFDYNNSSYINITRSGYIGVAKSEWCTQSNGGGTCFDQTKSYTYNDYKAVAKDKTAEYEVSLYVNWKKKPVRMYFHPHGGVVRGPEYTTYDSWISKDGVSYYYWEMPSDYSDGKARLWTFSELTLTRNGPNCTIPASDHYPAETHPTKYQGKPGKEWCAWIGNTNKGCFDENVRYTYATYVAASAEKSTFYELDLWANWELAEHCHTWTQKGHVPLDINYQYALDGVYVKEANGLYCSQCHMSAWCYGYNGCGGSYRYYDRNFAGGTLYALKNFDGVTVWNDEPDSMTFERYQSYTGIYGS